MATYKLVDSEKLDADLTTVADAIRAKTGGEEPLSFPEGMAGEMDAVFEAGKKSEWDAFWDAYQEDGRRDDYLFAFSGLGWTDNIFRPKYDIVPRSAYCMFRACAATNLEQAIEDSGIELNFGNAIRMDDVFRDAAKLTIVPEIDARRVTQTGGLGRMFSACVSLITVRKLILPEDGIIELTSTFDNCTSLINITFEGVIRVNINIRWSSLLSKDSIASVLDALSLDTTGLTVTLSLTAVNNAFETSAGAADGSTSAEWATLIATKPNWTISLV